MCLSVKILQNRIFSCGKYFNIFFKFIVHSLVILICPQHRKFRFPFCPPIPLRQDLFSFFKKISFMYENDTPFRGQGGLKIIICILMSKAFQDQIYHLQSQVFRKLLLHLFFYIILQWLTNYLFHFFPSYLEDPEIVFPIPSCSRHTWRYRYSDHNIWRRHKGSD